MDLSKQTRSNIKVRNGTPSWLEQLLDQAAERLLGSQGDIELSVKNNQAAAQRGAQGAAAGGRRVVWPQRNSLNLGFSLPLAPYPGDGKGMISRNGSSLTPVDETLWYKDQAKEANTELAAQRRRKVK